MKLKMLVGTMAIVTCTSAFLFSGCNQPKMVGVPNDIPFTTSEVEVEDVSEVAVLDVEEPEYTEDDYTDEDWALLIENDENSVVRIDYVNPIRDDYLLPSGKTYGDFTHTLTSGLVPFDKDAFDKIFAAQFINERLCSQVIESHTDMENTNVVSYLVMVADFISKNELTVESAEMDSDTGIYTYFTKDKNGNEFHIIWDKRNMSLTAYSPLTEQSMDCGMPITEDWFIASYYVYVYEYFQEAEKVTDTSEQEPSEQRIIKATGKTLQDCNYQYIKGYEDEIEQALYDFYGCNIESVKDGSYATTEYAEITMKDGRVCKYIGKENSLDFIDQTEMKTVWNRVF